jgi:hypothetical protein
MLQVDYLTRPVYLIHVVVQNGKVSIDVPFFLVTTISSPRNHRPAGTDVIVIATDDAQHNHQELNNPLINYTPAQNHLTDFNRATISNASP